MRGEKNTWRITFNKIWLHSCALFPTPIFLNLVCNKRRHVADFDVDTFPRYKWLQIHYSVTMRPILMEACVQVSFYVLG